ncbi:MAG TPA: threonine--tRNA ligase [Candidatus Nanoarchaeia archaeon]|nr:threonine--tRNA ligase [Candidatus Nanoarchaeia archaeon]
MAFMDEDQKEFRASFWHTAAHLLGHAVLQLYPDAKRTIGPAIDSGFYYDFFQETPFTPEDLEKIEKRMQEIAKGNHPLFREDKSASEAKEFYKGNPFKLELIDEFAPGGQGTLSFYCHADYKDLCKGGHVENTGEIKAIKLLKTSGAYWRGDAKNQQLQRIYGIAFPSRDELKNYLKQLEEAEKRDHRKIGKELDLFSFHEVSPGSPFFHPKGTIVYLTLQNFLRSLYPSWGYQEVITPLIYDCELWKQSGHWEHYRENMFEVKMDSRDAAMKPMNCPSHIIIYKTNLRSYRDLPLRITDFAALHRNELKGVLGGLTRVRKFSQDDCHVFCTPEQVKGEIQSLIRNAQYVYEKVFGFCFHVELSTKPEKAMGDPKLWEVAEKSLQEALDESNVKYKINPGDGAFYGPKIDFHIKDALGRSWQCGTEQLDFQQPERFNVEYEGGDGKKHRVVMLHRTVLGSLERFMGVLIEHYAGRFPLWLSPIQVKVLNITDNQLGYATKVVEKLKEAGLRVELDDRSLTLGKKIREAQLEQANFIVVIGDKEVQENSVNIRSRDAGVLGSKEVDVFITELLEEVKKRA